MLPLVEFANFFKEKPIMYYFSLNGLHKRLHLLKKSG